MLEDWLDEKIAHAWSNAVSEYGDIFQQAIVKPFILGTLMAIHKQRSLDSKNLGTISASAGHNTYWLLGTLLSKLDPAAQECNQDILARAWAQSLEEHQPDLTGLRLLDLGGGEAYLGHWLADRGADVTSVDGCHLLVEMAESRAKRRRSRRGALRSLKGDLTDASPDHEPEWLRPLPRQGVCHDAEAPTTRPAVYDAVVCIAGT